MSDDLKKMLSEVVQELSESNDADDLMLWLQARCEGMFPESEELSQTQLKVLQKSFTEIEKISFDKDGKALNWNRRYAFNIVNQLGSLQYSPNVGLGVKTVQKLLKLKSLPLVLRWMLDPKGFDYKGFNCYWVFFYDGAEVLSKIGAMKIPALRKAFQKELKRHFSAKLAEVYYCHFSAG